MFGCVGFSLLCRLFSRCGDWGYFLAEEPGVSWGAQSPRHLGFVQPQLVGSERRLSGCGAQASCTAARGVFPDRALLHLQTPSYPLLYYWRKVPILTFFFFILTILKCMIQ